MYLIHNEGKSVAAERFICPLKTKIYKYMISVSKNVYIHKLDDIVDEYNNTYHGTINMKSANVKDDSYINFKKEVNDGNPKFKIGKNHVRIFKCKNIFAKDKHQTGLKKLLLLVKLKIKFHGHMLLMILMVKKLLKHLMKKNCKRLIKKKLE